MTRRPCAFREADVRRAIRAAQKAGIDIASVEIGQDGKIVILTGKGEAPTSALARWKKQREDRDARQS